MRRDGRAISWVILSLVLASLGLSCDRGGTSAREDVLTLGAYSVVREVFHDGLIPEFARIWKTKTGRDLRFEESYNGSGAQARAIASGFDADIAVLSLDSDMELLVKAGVVKKDWNEGPDRGIVTNSLVVIGHRDRPDLPIHDWGDLTRPGVGVLYPDPKTSGGARWNIAAIWGAGLLSASRSTRDAEAARNLLARIQANVVIMDSSGRQSLSTFDRGIGDALVTYENELLLRRKYGKKPIPYVTPDATLRIESPVALVETSVDRHGNREVAQAFLAFLISMEGQKILASYGFRPVNPDAKLGDFPPIPARLFTIRDLGGWTQVKRTVFDQDGVWAKTFTDRAQGK